MHGRVSPVVPSLILRLEAAVFAAMPEAHDEDRRGRDFVAHLIVADDDPANLTWLIGFQLFADPRIIEQPVRRVGELLDNPRRRLGCARAKLLVQTHKGRRRLTGPLDLHLTGNGSGFSVLRLSATPTIHG